VERAARHASSSKGLGDGHCSRGQVERDVWGVTATTAAAYATTTTGICTKSAAATVNAAIVAVSVTSSRKTGGRGGSGNRDGVDKKQDSLANELSCCCCCGGVRCRQSLGRATTDVVIICVVACVMSTSSTPRPLTRLPFAQSRSHNWFYCFLNFNFNLSFYFILSTCRLWFLAALLVVALLTILTKNSEGIGSPVGDAALRVGKED
jgi:hypothetical protein